VKSQSEYPVVGRKDEALVYTASKFHLDGDQDREHEGYAMSAGGHIGGIQEWYTTIYLLDASVADLFPWWYRLQS
jgi:hypothetical protein